VGFHSHTHRNCARLNPAEIVEETSQGLALFDQELGKRPACFAFPYGHSGSYSAETIDALKEHGLEIFFSTELGRTPLTDAGPFSRIVIHPEDDLQSFRRKLYGGYDWVGKLQRFGYSVGASVRPRF
jgi:peptidoglycan/xylan/chitin deacetylase (PgdA/CDA1 family)